MFRRIVILTFLSMIFMLSGCAAGFRAGGPNTGIDAGAAIGREPVYVHPDR